MNCPICKGQGYRVYQGMEFPCGECRGRGTVDNGNTNRIEVTDVVKERKKRKRKVEV